MNECSRAYANIHLDRIRGNMEEIRRNLTEGTKVIGVVKADGYGHGAVFVAKTIDPYVEAYAVATFEEAVQLRKHGITKEILILGVTPEVQYRKAIEEEISMTVFRLDWAKKLSMLAWDMGKKAKIHIAVDTGMGRIGFMPTEEAAEIVKEIASLPGIELKGMFTHFARADEMNKETAKLQMKKFLAFHAMLKKHGIDIPTVHCSNSAGIVDMKEANLDAVRAGIILYGLYPSDEVEKERLLLRPAMELKSFITYKKQIFPGMAVSYGGTFVAEHEMTIGTVGIGYGDGYPRNLSGKGSVLVCGRRAPILGRVCMDQLMIDLSEIPEAEEGTEVTLLGADGEECITMEELAEICGGFHYEIPCLLGKRIPRVYRENGRVVGMQTCEEIVWENK